MTRIYALYKPLPDVHTLGINTLRSLLTDCGETALIYPESNKTHQQDLGTDRLRHWLMTQHVTHFGLSYRLDPEDAVSIMRECVRYMSEHHLLARDKGPISRLYFAGLPESCQKIKAVFGPLITVFDGHEDAIHTLMALEVPKERIPLDLIEGSRYDQIRHELAASYIRTGAYKDLAAPVLDRYPEFGTRQDRLWLRLQSRRKVSDSPLTRVHVGPYQQDRLKAIEEFEHWCMQLAKSRYLDICSIGSSQLTQSHFGLDWTGLHNGGGVPIQNAKEYERIYECSRPMLMRTYSGTHLVDQLVKVHEDTLNIAWHALSFWWFNQLDGRGPNDLLTNLHQHLTALKFIAADHKPFEPNVPHHFAFRGADDVTYVVSAVLSAQLAKQFEIHDFVLQIMLNTPRSTWGIQDLAKARSILKLIDPLVDDGFKVYLQPRAGLDYFSADLEEAKIQLASVSMLMEDIEPDDQTSPAIIHVVSYCEAVHLATPPLIDESIKITLGALAHYRSIKKKDNVLAPFEEEIHLRTQALMTDAGQILDTINELLNGISTPVGLAALFESGFLPVPNLWGNPEEHPFATHFHSRFHKGATILTDPFDQIVTVQERIDYAMQHWSACVDQLNKAYFKMLLKSENS